jgi:MscS family membrane protein
MKIGPSPGGKEKCFAASLLLLALMGVCPLAGGQEATDPDITTIVEDEFNRGTPKRSAEGFLKAVDAHDYETAAEYLDLRNLRGAASELSGEQLARNLDVVVQRAEWIDIDELVDDPDGRSGDGLPDYRDSIGVIVANGKEIRMLMQKVPRGDGESIWKISNATVSQIPALLEAFGYPQLVEDLRHRLPNVSFLGFELFKWVLVLAAALITYGAVFLISFATWRILGDPRKPSHRRIFRFFTVPFGIWSVLLTMNHFATVLGRGVTAETMQRLSPIPIVVTVWVIFAGISLLREIYSDHLESQDRKGALVLLRPAGNAIKLFVFLGACLFYLDKLGINITTLLAGLGVGGIAVALALQKPMEDVFGAITLYAQQPVRVGDFCRIGNTTGTIEEIGLRTTYIRTLANTRIAVPNAKLASEAIDNISARQRILYRINLRLRYDTKPGQIRSVMEGIREMLKENDRVLEDGQRVRFIEIADDALKIEVFAHLDTTVWAEYLELAEELNLRILEIVAEAGTSLSLPASTLRVEQGPGDALSPARAT